MDIARGISIIALLLLLYAVVACVPVALIGQSRRIGFWGSFWISFFFSPILALVVVLLSKRKSDLAFQQQMLQILSDKNIPNSHEPIPISNQIPTPTPIHTNKTSSSLGMWLLVLFLLASFFFGLVMLKESDFYRSLTGKPPRNIVKVSKSEMTADYDQEIIPKENPKKEEIVQKDYSAIIAELKQLKLFQMGGNLIYADSLQDLTFDEYMHIEYPETEKNYVAVKSWEYDDEVFITINHTKDGVFEFDCFVRYLTNNQSFIYETEWYGD